MGKILTLEEASRLLKVAPVTVYRKARRGEIPDFTGISAPYQPPRRPELVLHTDRTGPEACVAELLAFLESRGYLSAV